jgi:hypothetical protein
LRLRLFFAIPKFCIHAVAIAFLFLARLRASRHLGPEPLIRCRVPFVGRTAGVLEQSEVLADVSSHASKTETLLFVYY